MDEDADQRRARALGAQLRGEGELTRRERNGRTVVAFVLVGGASIATAVVVVLLVVRQAEHEHRHLCSFGGLVRCQAFGNIRLRARGIAASRLPNKRARITAGTDDSAGRRCWRLAAGTAGTTSDTGGVLLSLIPRLLIAVPPVPVSEVTTAGIRLRHKTRDTRINKRLRITARGAPGVSKGAPTWR